jgi:uncharacterized membrane protein YsdA (DUF1294 family)
MPRRLEARDLLRLGAALLLVAIIAAAILLGRVPLYFAALYLVAGLASAVNYWRDKRAAGARSWRVPESTLLGLDLLFGTVGGLLAQYALRHKTQKRSFVTATALIAALHVAGLAALATGLVRLPPVILQLPSLLAG